MSSGVGVPEVTMGEAEKVKGCHVRVFLFLLESRHILHTGSSELTLEQECWRTSSTKGLQTVKCKLVRCITAP